MLLSTQLNIIKRINPEGLSPKQKENYNFHKQAAVLADYGFNCIKLTDDWEGADFLAHRNEITLKVQLKSRTAIAKKYIEKDLYILFPLDDTDVNSDWCLIKHDILIELIANKLDWLNTKSWVKEGIYNSSKTPKAILPDLQKYLLKGQDTLIL